MLLIFQKANVLLFFIRVDRTIEQNYSKQIQIMQKQEYNYYSFQELEKNLCQHSELQQLLIYNKEANLLSNLMNQIDWPDQLSISIKQYQQKLNQLTNNNKDVLLKIYFNYSRECYTHQINLTQLYISQQIEEYELNLARQRISNYQNELNLLKQ
ncbi:unnamed protein product [Paramecium sonneborni]|uniref:Uncharacterized protein n=1 Tax=Paramecium sonneborni TaxID=65129 RepID=A0A8S1RRC1_9CILI|nr:unnamed protein product [Paramecium sonneborni]